MGLIRSVDNIERSLNASFYSKEAERIKKQREKEQKENLKRYKTELEEYTKEEFNKYFEIGSSCYLIEFYNKERKQEILKEYFDTIKITDNNGFEKIPYKKELTQHFYNKYDTFLKKAYKNQVQHEEYLNTIEAKEIEEQQKELEEKEGKWKKWENKEFLNKIFLIPILVIFFPVLFILAIIFGTFKGMK